MVRLSLYDMIGREVRTIINQYQPAGFYSENVRLEDLPSGMYFYRLLASSENGSTFDDSKRLNLIK